LKKSFIACSVVFALNSNEKQPDIINILKTGKWKGHINGEFELSKEDLEQIKTNFDNSPLDVVIDIDHANVFNGTGEAQGWVKTLEIQKEELQGGVTWLEHGKDLLKSEKYKYISPVIVPNTIDEVTGEDIGWTLHSIAITNRPFFEDLGEIKLNNKSSDQGEKTMSKSQKELEKENKELESQNAQLQELVITTQVDNAISANKATEDQRDSLIALGKSNPEELTKLLAASKPIGNPFNGDHEQLAGSKEQGGGKNNETKLSKEELEA